MTTLRDYGLLLACATVGVFWPFMAEAGGIARAVQEDWALQDELRTGADLQIEAVRKPIDEMAEAAGDLAEHENIEAWVRQRSTSR